MSTLAPRSATLPQAVPDWKTDAVTLVLPTAEMYAYNRDLAALELLYADLCRELARYDSVECLVPDAAHAEKMARLSGIGPEHFPLGTIPDIWIRDFAPIPVTGGLVRFRYAPRYTRREINAQIESAVRRHFGRCGQPVSAEDVALEGGNLVHNGAGVGIATERLFSSNRGTPRAEVVERIRRALGLERLILIPPEPGDRTGHSDGMLRFANERLLLVNDYTGASGNGRFLQRLERVLDRKLPDVERIRLPYPVSSEKRDGWYDARGNYVNFLLTGRRIYAPAYGLAEDAAALEVFERLFPGRVSCVDASPVARYGGSINCITWNHVRGDGAHGPIGRPPRRPRPRAQSRPGARRGRPGPSPPL